MGPVMKVLRKILISLERVKDVLVDVRVDLSEACLANFFVITQA